MIHTTSGVAQNVSFSEGANQVRKPYPIRRIPEELSGCNCGVQVAGSTRMLAIYLWCVVISVCYDQEYLVIHISVMRACLPVSNPFGEFCSILNS